MQTLTVRFTTKWPYNPASWLIAHATGSRKWSHVMAIVGDTVYESVIFYRENGKLKTGVRKVPIDVAMRGVVGFVDMTVPVPNLKDSVEWAERMVGRKYDFFGAIGLPFLASDDWANDNEWWCSEFVFMMLGTGDQWVLDPNEKKRVTPNDLFQCNFIKSNFVNLR